MRSFPFCETGRYLQLTLEIQICCYQNQRFNLLPKAPLVKLPGIKLYPLTWLDRPCQAKFPLHYNLPVFPPNLLSKNIFFTGKTTLSGKVLFCVFYIKGKAGEAVLIAMPWLYLRINTSFLYSEATSLIKTDAALDLGQQYKINLGYRDSLPRFKWQQFLFYNVTVRTRQISNNYKVSLQGFRQRNLLLFLIYPLTTYSYNPTSPFLHKDLLSHLQTFFVERVFPSLVLKIKGQMKGFLFVCSSN